MPRRQEAVERLWTVREVADYLRIDPKTVRRLISEGKLAAYRLRREWRISDRDLRKYLHEIWSG